MHFKLILLVHLQIKGKYYLKIYIVINMFIYFINYFSQSIPYRVRYESKKNILKISMLGLLASWASKR